MSLVIFCLLFSFVDYVPVNGEIIWYLSLTTCLINIEIEELRTVRLFLYNFSSFIVVNSQKVNLKETLPIPEKKPHK